jgi:hypothetical protein
MGGVDQCPLNSDLNETLANQISIHREPQTVMAGLVPAIYEPDAAPFVLQEGADHRVEPSDDVYPLGVFSTQQQPFGNWPRTGVARSAKAAPI